MKTTLAILLSLSLSSVYAQLDSTSYKFIPLDSITLAEGFELEQRNKVYQAKIQAIVASHLTPKTWAAQISFKDRGVHTFDPEKLPKTESK